MSVLCDKSIAARCGILMEQHDVDGEIHTAPQPDDHFVHQPMVEPFVPHQVRYEDDKKILSYGLSSGGYDVRISTKFKIFTNVQSALIDPLNIDDKCFFDIDLDKTGADHIIIPPNSYALGVTKEYFRIPKDIFVICLGKSTYARCFDGETRIALVNNESVTFKEMVARTSKGERFWGYGVDERGEIIVIELTAPQKIGRERVIKITLDNGEEIVSTPDHGFLRRDGTYARADELETGDSLFPLYRTVTRGYEAVVQPKDFLMTSTHWLADQWNIRHNAYPAISNCHRHHVNNDRRDNRPINILRMAAGEHIRQHNAERSNDLEYLTKLSDIQKKAYLRNSRDETWMADRLKNSLKGSAAFWNDDRFAEARASWRRGMVERGAEMSEAQRNVRRERLRIANLDPSRRQRHQDMLAERWLDEEFKSLMREKARNLKLRKDVSEELLRAALDKHGSVHGAARELNCDRSTFRRFKNVIAEYKVKWETSKVTITDILSALKMKGTIRGAARLLGIDPQFIRRRKELLSEFFQSPIAENHKVVSIESIEDKRDVYCLTAPETGNFALEAGVFVENCASIVNVTPIEPGFEGEVVIEISNASPCPLKIYANQGIAQFVFFEMDEPALIGYDDRKGKYQGQRGLTLARG